MYWNWSPILWSSDLNDNCQKVDENSNRIFYGCTWVLHNSVIWNGSNIFNMTHKNHNADDKERENFVVLLIETQAEVMKEHTMAILNLIVFVGSPL